MSTETQNNTPVSAESVAHAGLLPCPFCGGSAHLSRACDLVNVRCDGWNPGECLGAGPNCYTEAEAVASWNRRAAPIAAQPDVTQQTLDDVMAGIPARDAEIEALRKQVETLQAQLVDRSPEMQGKPIDASPILQGQQQPASNADGLPLILHDLNTSAGGRGFVAEYFESRVGRYDFTRYIRDRLAADFACALAAHLSQQDVLQAEVLGMVRMLEANEWADHCGQSELGKRLEGAITALQNQLQNIPKNIPGPSQQDADNDDELFYKLGCFIDYATGGRLSKLNWPLATLKQSHDENLEALIAERIKEANEDKQDADKVDAWQCTTTLQESDDLIWLYCQDTNTIDGPVKSNPEFIDAWTHWAWVEHPSTAAIDAARREQA